MSLAGDLGRAGRAAPLFASVLLGLGCTGKPGAAPASPAAGALPEIVARVNGQPIPRAHLEAVAATRLKGQEVSAEVKARICREALPQLIERELLLQEAMARGIAVDDAQLARDYDEQRGAFADEVSWRRHLLRLGFSAQTLKTELRVKRLVQALVDAETQRIPAEAVSAGELQAYYEGHPELFDSGPRLRLSEILVKVPKDSTDQQRLTLRAKAEALRKLAARGDDFARLARQSSDEEGSRAQGGLLPEVEAAAMPAEVVQAVAGLQPGGVSVVVESDQGYYVFKLHARRPGDKIPLAQVATRLRDELLQRRREQHLRQFLAQLTARAKIETFL